MKYHSDINDSKKIHKINFTKWPFDDKLRTRTRMT